MSEYLRLAELLEAAAKKLREADKALEGIRHLHAGRRLDHLLGYERLGTRVDNVLHNHGILLVDQLLEKSAHDLELDCRGIGPDTLRRVREFLSANGLRLRDDPPAAETGS